MIDEHDELVYLEFDDALEIYAAIIRATAAQAADHLRSADALQGALGQSQTYAHYEQADLALQAAVLAHGIAETQPFHRRQQAHSAGRDADLPRAQ